MKKAEIISDLNSRVIKTITTHAPSTLNGGDKEYSFTCVIDNGEGFSEENYSIRVVDEGLDTEAAGYVRGKQPPAKISREGLLKQRMEYLKTLGVIKWIDISQLGVPFAKFSIDGQPKFAVDLDGELVVEDAE